jgi:hypothetical protein
LDNLLNAGNRHPSFEPSDFLAANNFNLLGILSSDGYKIVDFSTVDPARKHLVLRHDIVFDMEAAAGLAQIEQERSYSAI